MESTQPQPNPESMKGYFRETTVHGFRYIVDAPNAPVRFIWLLVVLGAFIVTGHLLSTSFEEQYQNPTMTNYQDIPINDIPFPAMSFSMGTTM